MYIGNNGFRTSTESVRRCISLHCIPDWPCASGLSLLKHCHFTLFTLSGLLATLAGFEKLSGTMCVAVVLALVSSFPLSLEVGNVLC